MNYGGFSWRRFVGITRIKQDIAKSTGVPFTTQGRNAKIGRAAQGKGSMLSAIFLVIINAFVSKK